MLFSEITDGVLRGLEEWEPVLAQLDEETVSDRRNSQNRNIRQILGHMADSASNNTHRIIHLQYQNSPFSFPNYATNGNNERWIAIQNYNQENWNDMIMLWKYLHLHLVHVISNVDNSCLDNEWIAGPDEGNVSLKDMINDFLRHFRLHLSEIQELTDL